MEQEVQVQVEITLSLPVDLEKEDITQGIEQSLMYLGTNLNSPFRAEMSRYKNGDILSNIMEADVVRLTEETDLYAPDRDVRAWGFVEENYPNYSSCELIAESNDLSMITEDWDECVNDPESHSFSIIMDIADKIKWDFEETSILHVVRNDRGFEEKVKQYAGVMLNDVNAQIYEASIEAFLKKQIHKV